MQNNPALNARPDGESSATGSLAWKSELHGSSTDRFCRIRRSCPGYEIDRDASNSRSSLIAPACEKPSSSRAFPMLRQLYQASKFALLQTTQQAWMGRIPLGAL